MLSPKDRPERLYIPLGVRREAADLQGSKCPCGCGTPCWADKKRTKALVQWDHMPALRLRDINPEGTDYIPAQLDPRYLVGRCRESHAAKTHGQGATTAGTDTGAIKKERKRGKPPRIRTKMRSRPMGKTARPWPKGQRKIQSKPFPKRVK